MGADDISLVSTTDSPEDVAAALGAAPPAEAKPAADAVVTPPVVEEKPAAAAATTEKPAAGDPPPAETQDQMLDRERKSSRERRQAKIQSEIDQAIARREAARAEAADAERRAADAKRLADEAEAKAKATAPPAPPDAAAQLGPKPKLNDTTADGQPKYADYEDWVADVAKWHADNASAVSAARDAEIEARIKHDITTAERERVARSQAARDEHESLTKWNTHLESFKAAHAPDYDAVLAGAKDFVDELVDEHGPDVMNVVDRFTTRDAFNGPAIVHHLAQNPGELRQIVALPVPQQIAALGRLDARLEVASKEPARSPAAPVTRAPQPMKPVGGTPTAPTVSPEDEDYSSYKARRNKEERDRQAALAR